jgi:DNA-binding transcriptional LysR family regulator
MAPLDWNDVHLFLAVLRAGSLRAAARELRIDVSTVSRRLDQLEKVAATRLLVRNARRLELTAAGAHVATTAERMAAAIAELQPKIAAADRGVGGLVRVTAPGSLLPTLSVAIKNIRAVHPRIEFEILTFDALIPIDGTHFEIAVRVCDAPPENLVGTRLMRLSAAVYASIAYTKHSPAALEDAPHPWVEWDRRLASKPIYQWIGERFPDRSVVARGLSTIDVHALIRSGVGIGVLPCCLGDADTSLRRMGEIPDEVASSVWLLTHPELRNVPRIRAVMTAIRREVTRIKQGRDGGANPISLSLS